MHPAIAVQGPNPDRQPKSGGLFPLLQHAAAQWPSDIAIARGTQTLSFYQLKSAAEQLAIELVKAEIRPGFRVGVMCPNGPEYVIGSLSLFLLDAVVVPIFPGLKESEIAALGADLELDAYCYSPQLANQLPPRLQGSLISVDLQAGKLALNIERCEQHDSKLPDRHDLASLGAPLIRFTSGTTSKAKGVIIPQSSMLEYTERFASVYGIERDDYIFNRRSMR